jgi:hypothetical protein
MNQIQMMGAKPFTSDNTSYSIVYPWASYVQVNQIGFKDDANVVGEETGGDRWRLLASLGCCESTTEAKGWQSRKVEYNGEGARSRRE